MQPDEHLRQFRLDGHRMADLAAGDLAAPVPTCPDWTLADLIEHTGVVHRWQAAVVRDDPPDFPDPATWRFLPEDEAPSEWFRRGVDEAIEVMAAADPDAPRWSWAGPTRSEERRVGRGWRSGGARARQEERGDWMGGTGGA